MVCSVGKVRIDGETTTLSFGILNQVFTFSKETMKEAMSKEE